MSGMTVAHFQVFGNVLTSNEVLMSFVRDGKRHSRHDLRSVVGMGSRWQCLLFVDRIVFRTSSSVTLLK